MKTTAASALAFLPFLAIVSAFEVPYWDKMSIGGTCKDIRIDGKYVLHASCVSAAENPDTRRAADLSLDLNHCFANYLGTLNYAADGGFGGSCSECHLDDKYNLVCQCGVGEGQPEKTTTHELDDWKVIKISGDGSSDLSMTCHSSEGIEKRADKKAARTFVA